MRILFAHTRFDRSETEMCRGFVHLGAEVDAVCEPGWKGGAALVEGGVVVTELSIRHRLDLRAARTLRNLLRARRPDIVYAPLNSTLSVSLMATRGLGIKVIGYRGTIGHLSRWDPAAWLTYLHPRLDRIVCVSKAVERYLTNMRIPAERLRTIYKGHRVSWYEYDQSVSLSEFGVPDAAFVVGFTGSIRPVKGVDVLLRSIEHLPADLNAHFLLVGDVRDKRIPKIASGEGIRQRVHFAGFRSDAAAVTGAFDVFVMPSVEREGLPRAVIEAMAQSIPPIVTNVGGMPELVVDRECGLVVPPRDPEALADAIVALARNPGMRREYGRRARERIQTHFNIEHTTEQMLALFREVLEA